MPVDGNNLVDDEETDPTIKQQMRGVSPGDGDEEELSGANRETYQFQSVDQSAERTKRNATEVKVKTEEPHTSQSVRSRKVPFRNEMINAS